MYYKSMKFLFNLRRTLGVVLLSCVVTTVQCLEVKVLLEPSVVGSVRISSSKELIVQDPVRGITIQSLANRTSFDIEVHEDGGYLGHKKIFNETLSFVAQDGATILYNAKKYKGSLIIKKIKGVYAVINSVPLEDYVFSVLKTESWPGWPLEINRVLAIVTRTYCLYQMMKAHKAKQPYDIRNTNHHQTYHGVHACKISHQAVEDTRGVFISYERRPILAMFDCCCGGVIPAHIEGVIDFTKAPYLERTYACLYCRGAKLCNWTATYRLNDFIDLIQSECDSIVHGVKDVKIAQQDAAGLVKKMAIKTPQGLITLTGEQVYRLSNKIKSFSFSITKKGKMITFKGRGFGHHIGLCQWGAREMVRRGFDFKEIIDFYYPDTTLLCFSDQQTTKRSKKGAVCRDIKDILSAAPLRSLA